MSSARNPQQLELGPITVLKQELDDIAIGLGQCFGEAEDGPGVQAKINEAHLRYPLFIIFGTLNEFRNSMIGLINANPADFNASAEAIIAPPDYELTQRKYPSYDDYYFSILEGYIKTNIRFISSLNAAGSQSLKTAIEKLKTMRGALDKFINRKTQTNSMALTDSAIHLRAFLYHVPNFYRHPLQQLHA